MDYPKESGSSTTSKNIGSSLSISSSLIGDGTIALDTITREKYSGEEMKIEEYLRRKKEWYFEIIEKYLLPHKHTGYTILFLSVAYLEESAELRGVKGNYHDLICSSIERIFKLTKNDEKNKIADWIRNGFFHEGHPKTNVTLIGDGEAIKIERTEPDKISLIKINPLEFFNKILADFENYSRKLKDTTSQERKEFLKNFIC